METTLQTATQLVPKEQLPGLISLNPIDVLLTDPERKYRNRMLYLAMILGNGYKSKVKITFHSIDGPRTVETTVWATTEATVMLKGGISLPIVTIYSVDY
jgi:hypothetical protein